MRLPVRLALVCPIAFVICVCPLAGLCVKYLLSQPCYKSRGWTSLLCLPFVPCCLDNPLLPTNCNLFETAELTAMPTPGSVFSASLPTGFNAVVFSHSINSVEGAIVGFSRQLLMQVRGQGQGWMQS